MVSTVIFHESETHFFAKSMQFWEMSFGKYSILQSQENGAFAFVEQT